MAISYGFFDSKNHDRLYKANEFGRLFDGIITDGIFDNIGNEFIVTPSGNGLTVLIDTGRAWFNNIWINNDARYPITPEDADPLYNRIDAVVIEVNKNDDVRKGYINIVKGAESGGTPSKPELTRTDGVYQYALAYLTIPANLSIITDDNIEYVVGSEETPFVSAQVNQISIDNLYAALNQEFNNYFADWTSEKYQDFELFMTDVVNELSETEIGELQNRIDSKSTAPIELTTYVVKGGGTASVDDPNIDFTNYDYAVDVYSNPFGLQMINCSGHGSYVSLTFKEADQYYDIKVLVRKL